MMWFKMSTFQEYMKRRRTKIVDVEGILIEIVTIFVNFPSISNALLPLVLVAHVFLCMGRQVRRRSNHSSSTGTVQ